MSVSIRKSISAMFIAAITTACTDSTETTGGDGQGTSGSLAAMAVQQGKLHVLEPSAIQSFELEQTPTSPIYHSTSYLGGSNRAQTLFRYDSEYMFVGTSIGVEIKKWQVDEENGTGEFKHINTITHLQAYDPVVAKGNYAYFTTRNGVESLNTSADLVGIIDISAIDNAQVVFRYEELDEPHGLALHGDHLYVCDKAEGLTKFKIEGLPSESGAQEDSDQSATDVIAELTGPTLVKEFLTDVYPCNDVIALNDRLILTSTYRVTQLQIFDSHLEIISVIESD